MTAPARSRRTTRLAGLMGVCVLAVVALTGCIKVDADLTINSDATGSGTFAFELQKEAAGFLGISDLASFEAQLTEGELSGDSGLGTFDECTSSESDAGYVYSCTFSDTAFTSPDDGPWVITKDGDKVTFTMESNAQTDPTATEGQDLLGDASMGSINVNVTFPGTITSLTGEGATKTSDTTATISGSLTENISATITSETGGGGMSTSALIVILVAVAVIVLIIIAVIVMLSRRGKSAPVDGTDAAAAVGVATAAGVATDAAVAAPEAAETVVTEAVAAEAPVVEAPAVEAPVVETVEETVTDTVEPATETVQETVTEAVEPVTETAQETVTEVTETVEQPPAAEPENPTS